MIRRAFLALLLASALPAAAANISIESAARAISRSMVR